MLTIQSIRFGTIGVEQERLLTFSEGLPGLENMTRAVLVAPEDSHPILWLQDAQDGQLALPVVDPFLIRKDYVLEVPDAHIQQLKATSPEDLWVFTVLVIPEDTTRMTANLSSPILINHRLGLGRQVVLDDRRYDMRTPAFEPLLQAMMQASGTHTEGGGAHAGTDTQGG